MFVFFVFGPERSLLSAVRVGFCWRWTGRERPSVCDEEEIRLFSVVAR